MDGRPARELMAEEPEARDGRPVPVLAASLTERAVPHPECRRRATGARAQLEPRQLKSAASGGTGPSNPLTRGSGPQLFADGVPPAKLSLTRVLRIHPAHPRSHGAGRSRPRLDERSVAAGLASLLGLRPGPVRRARRRARWRGRERSGIVPPADPEAGSRPLRPARRAFHGSFVRARRAPGPGSPLPRRCDPTTAGPRPATRPRRWRMPGHRSPVPRTVGAHGHQGRGVALPACREVIPRTVRAEPGEARAAPPAGRRSACEGATESGVLSCPAVPLPDCAPQRRPQVRILLRVSPRTR